MATNLSNRGFGRLHACFSGCFHRLLLFGRCLAAISQVAHRFLILFYMWMEHEAETRHNLHGIGGSTISGGRRTELRREEEEEEAAEEEEDAHPEICGRSKIRQFGQRQECTSGAGKNALLENAHCIDNYFGRAMLCNIMP